MRIIILLASFLFCAGHCFGQAEGLELHDQLYALQARVRKGELTALRELAPYLDDTTRVRDFLGYHLLRLSARSISMRILSENTLFSGQELVLDSSLTRAKLVYFLDHNPVVFDSLTQEYLVTPLGRRPSAYQLVQADEGKTPFVPEGGVYPTWYYYRISGLISQHDPYALVLIAARWYWQRSRFNEYYFDDPFFHKLMQSLTGVEVGVTDSRGGTTFLIGNDYEAIDRLNYLIYWVHHYTDYQWNSRLDRFENVAEKVNKKDRLTFLFGQLSNKNDSVAMKAFTELTESDPERVRELSLQYDNAEPKPNYELPMFTFRFLNQLARLTQYCREQGIAYRPSGWLYDSLERLRTGLSFAQRYRLEESIIGRLSLMEVTQVEYWGALYQQDWDCTYSIGRILDKFYSKNWAQLVTQQKELELYLKKSYLFDRFGIIGNCNKYLVKFTNATDSVLQKVKNVERNTRDENISHEANAVLSRYAYPIPRPRIVVKDTAQYGVPDFAARYKAVRSRKYKDSYGLDFATKKLLSGISYEQIGEALKLVEKEKKRDDDWYWFLNDDFRLPVDRPDTAGLRLFRKLYATHTEKEVYDYYLRESGLPCFDANGNLSMEKVYDILKYDVVDAFAGGGGSRREDGIYPLIKALEYRFGTRLDFARKFNYSEDMWTGNMPLRAQAWMNYLEDKKLVVPNPREPISISNSKE